MSATKGPSIAPRQSIAPSPQEASSPPPIAIKRSTGGSGIITSKEWVLPPRPKPGRKPSIDTPASKRKAQNRAAQRAFRERRATRAQELEEKLLEVEKERDIKEMGLINTMNKLKAENQFLLKNLERLRNEVNSLKSNSKNQTGGSPTNSYGSYNSASPANSNYSFQQISPAPSADSPPVFNTSQKYNTISSYSNSNLTPRSSNETPNKVDSNNFDCGVCLKDDCLCETVGLKEKNTKSIDETISNFKPMTAVSLKKRKASEDEIDFTAKFAKRPLPEFKRPSTSSRGHNRHESHIGHSARLSINEEAAVDDCGFCSDDTPCVCREAAKETARLNKSLTNDNVYQDNDNNHELDDKTDLPPIQTNPKDFRKTSLPVMHPGPSVEIRDITNLTPGAVPTVVTPTTKKLENEDNSKEGSDGGCTGNPGTCAQCQMDPMSTLFCTTVASKAKGDNDDDNDDDDGEGDESSASSPESKDSIKSETSDRLTDSNSSNDSIDEESNTPNEEVKEGVNAEMIAAKNQSNNLPSVALTPSVSDMFIPCADAYKTLSRHKQFNQVDFSTLVGKLTTRGMQVEVQSVANVLRELDRRVYN